ncbi:endonuclease/exonuclease/phosphatase family protein [Nocardioides sp. HDW12B]|uniref:endonuclease/exonuclease/phosphatase family protein n=1 Tax=Nocardioides sp. HDW12B TaxID=2714939 RepID=UPI00140B959F|nr:endonuclease/exonuclease/phosphatase family protein [Nocardioides sp. HDW12B]QIK68014.1 endonuclease/exonuclease/phosphatase family protein [Nocardioides sp. HDW12B]
MIRAVSANLGRRIAAARWARDILGSRANHAVDLVFLQEVPLSVDWAAVGDQAGFDMATEPDSNYRVRSVLLWRRGAVTGEAFPLPTAGYHGSYLAAARLDLPVVGETVAVSVHASPTVVAAEYLKQWVHTAAPIPEPRASAAPGELWDSDFVLATLAQLARRGLVLAAGDFNECLAWDTTHHGAWGEEYFARVADSGLVSLTHRDEAGEKQTAFTHDGLAYQLDHVLASASVADQVAHAPRVDATWSRERVIAGELSDHSPLWFEIG